LSAFIWNDRNAIIPQLNNTFTIETRQQQWSILLVSAKNNNYWSHSYIIHAQAQNTHCVQHQYVHHVVYECALKAYDYARVLVEYYFTRSTCIWFFSSIHMNITRFFLSVRAHMTFQGFRMKKSHLAFRTFMRSLTRMDVHVTS
jgi:hypothetical protein